jgi:hypothetical protein
MKKGGIELILEECTATEGRWRTVTRLKERLGGLQYGIMEYLENRES